MKLKEIKVQHVPIWFFQDKWKMLEAWNKNFSREKKISQQLWSQHFRVLANEGRAQFCIPVQSLPNASSSQVAGRRVKSDSSLCVRNSSDATNTGLFFSLPFLWCGQRHTIVKGTGEERENMWIWKALLWDKELHFLALEHTQAPKFVRR